MIYSYDYFIIILRKPIEVVDHQRIQQLPNQENNYRKDVNISKKSDQNLSRISFTFESKILYF